MPTPFEELNERYKSMTGPYKPRTSPAGGQPPARSGIWDAIRREFSQIRTGGAGQFGADYLTPPAASPANRALNRAQQQTGGIFGDIGQGLSVMGKNFAETAEIINRGPHRDRRLEMAGLKSPEMGVSHAKQTPQGRYSPRTDTPDQASQVAPVGEAMKEPATAGQSTANKAAYGSKTGAKSGPAIGVPATAPMTVPPQDQALMDPNRPDDMRAKFLKMAGMSLEDRERMINAMPEGQRPIHTIRGTTEGWYNPGQSREFATLPEAVSGVEGRPTYPSEQDREQKGLDRLTGMEKERYKSDKDYEALIKSSHIRAQAVRDAATIDAEASLKKGAAGSGGDQKWTYHETPDGIPFILEEKGGATLPVYLDEPSKAAGVLQSIGLRADDLAFGASVLEHMDRDMRNEAFKLLDPERKKIFYQVIEARKKSQTK